MAQNLKLDPKKRDYVVVNGSPIPSDRIEEAAYYALTIPQGAWLYGQPDQGSLLYTLTGKRVGTIEQAFASFANDAIKRQLVDTGKATAVQTENLQATRTGTSNQVEIIPNTKQIATQFNFNSV